MARPGDVELTLKQAAEECGLTAATLRVLANSGRLEARKFGRDWVVSRKALRAYLASRGPQGRRAENAPR